MDYDYIIYVWNLVFIQYDTFWIIIVGGHE